MRSWKTVSVDRVIETESRQVLERHARKERTAAWKAGLIISVLLLIPVILTFLFSIAIGGGLGIFSVTTASMLLVAALTAVPLMTEQKKLTKSILAGIFALLLILFFRGPHERRRTVPAARHPHHFRALRATVSFCDPGACAAARTVG